MGKEIDSEEEEGEAEGSVDFFCAACNCFITAKQTHIRNKCVTLGS